MLTVEKSDEYRKKDAANDAAKKISEIVEQVHAKRIVLFPFSHLSNELSSPESSVEALDNITKSLQEKYEVFRVPFGWYKEWEVKTKGHPLSVLSRSI
jgi:threonyl-tRNA synthetase